MSWGAKRSPKSTDSSHSWSVQYPNVVDENTASWSEVQKQSRADASWSTRKSAARGRASWEAAVAPSDPNRVPTWSNAVRKNRRGATTSWGSVPASDTDPLIPSSWSNGRAKRKRRKRDPNVPLTLDDELNDMMDAFEEGDTSMGHLNQEELLNQMDLNQKKEIAHTTVGEIEKGLIGYFIMAGGIFNAFRDSMPTVFPAAFFGAETYAKAQQTGNEVNDEITRFIADGKARGASKQLLEAMAEYGQHDPQFSNMRRAFAKAEKKNAHKGDKQKIDEIAAQGTEEEPNVKLHQYPPKGAQLMDYGIKSFFIDDITIGSFITRTEKSFIPFVQTLRPNVGFILHILNFIPALSTPDDMIAFLVKKAAHLVDPDNEHLEPFFNKVFLAVQPVLQPILSFFAFVINLFKPAMKELLDRSHIIAAFTDRVLKYVMMLAGMIWTVFAAIVHFIVQIVLLIVQLVLQVVLSIYASPWVGELVNTLLTIITMFV